MQGYIQGHHKQMLMWGKGWITELSIDLFIWRPRLEIFFFIKLLFPNKLFDNLCRNQVWSLKEKAQIEKIPSLTCKESSACAKIKTLVVLGVGAQIAWFGGFLA